MGEPIGVSPGDILYHQKSKEGGSLTFSYKQDFVAKTIGHVIAIPTTHLAAWTFRNAFENPSPKLVESLYERWKDVPWKGDVLVRVGHSSIIGDIVRLYNIDRPKLGEESWPSFFLNAWSMVARTTFLPSTMLGALIAKVRRGDSYNPFTRTVNVFHPELAVGMHEIGHAQFWDQTHPFSGAAFVLGRSFPIIRSFTEWKASAFAMKRFKGDEERRKATKILEGAFGTYLMGDMMDLTLPFLPSFFGKALTTTIGIPLRGAPWLIREMFRVAWTSGILAGSVAGHLLSRLPYPGKRQRFEWVFEGKQKSPGDEASGTQQVRYAFARAPETPSKI